MMRICMYCIRRAYASLLSYRKPASQLVPRHIRLTSSFGALENAAKEEKGASPAEPDAAVGNGEAQDELKEKKKLDWIVKKRLTYLKDPVKIAEDIERTLAKDKFEEALALTRAACRNTNVVVSWNHLIEYQFKHNRMRAAFKLFNEVSELDGCRDPVTQTNSPQMKKRAQEPNARTYTTIFSGCAGLRRPATAVSEASRLYFTMLSSQRVVPTTIHMNAAMTVCYKANELDTLFAILDTHTETGVRAPNNLTYTIAINALRGQILSIIEEPLDETPDERFLEIVQKNIQRAKALWEDAVRRWRKGQIFIDEELACAMGRILLMGDYKDNDSILDLVQQTMNIPRQDVKSLPAAAKTEVRVETSSTSPSSSGTSPADGALSNDGSQKELEKRPPSAAPGSYVKPGRNTLSMLLKSLKKTRKTTLAVRYWDIFTGASPHGHDVDPDEDNWATLMSVFRVGKASAAAVDALRRMPAEMRSDRVLRRAIAACLADNLNPHAFGHGGEVTRIMLRTTWPPPPGSPAAAGETSQGSDGAAQGSDVAAVQARAGSIHTPRGAKSEHGSSLPPLPNWFVLEGYLKLAHVTKRAASGTLDPSLTPREREDAAYRAIGPQVLEALDTLWGPWNRARQILQRQLTPAMVSDTHQSTAGDEKQDNALARALQTRHPAPTDPIAVRRLLDANPPLQAHFSAAARLASAMQAAADRLLSSPNMLTPEQLADKGPGGLVHKIDARRAQCSSFIVWWAEVRRSGGTSSARDRALEDDEDGMDDEMGGEENEEDAAWEDVKGSSSPARGSNKYKILSRKWAQEKLERKRHRAWRRETKGMMAPKVYGRRPGFGKGKEKAMRRQPLDDSPPEDATATF